LAFKHIDAVNPQVQPMEQVAIIEEIMPHLFINAGVSNILESFFTFVNSIGMSFKDLYNLYIGKNLLNEFRQNNGYKDGSYDKLWNGEEDNVVMQRELETNSTITPSELYEFLEITYDNLVRNKGNDHA
jgi:hypothetical protein